MEQLHATYQALKAAIERLYTEIYTKDQEYIVSKVRNSLDAALTSLEDELGVTQARIEGLKRKNIEDTPPPPKQPVEPSHITESPGDIAARVTDAANSAQGTASS